MPFLSGKPSLQNPGRIADVMRNPIFAGSGLGVVQVTKRSGLQYEFDKSAQAFTPQRTIDAWGLRHPLVNALSFVAVTGVLALACALALHAWYGVLLGAALGGLVTLRTQANHRRRVANGTSAEYGPPREQEPGGQAKSRLPPWTLALVGPVAVVLVQTFLTWGPVGALLVMLALGAVGCIVAATRSPR